MTQKKHPTDLHQIKVKHIRQPCLQRMATSLLQCTWSRVRLVPMNTWASGWYSILTPTQGTGVNPLVPGQDFGLAAQIIAPPYPLSRAKAVTDLSTSMPSHAPPAACSPGSKPMLTLAAMLGSPLYATKFLRMVSKLNWMPPAS